MPLESSKHVNGRIWQPGQPGNPNGRPVGSRTVFSQAFLKDLAEVWAEEGRETMVKTARNNPAVFFATCVRLIGPEVKPAGEVLEHVLGALRNCPEKACSLDSPLIAY
jgi:hypothetical protein